MLRLILNSAIVVILFATLVAAQPDEPLYGEYGPDATLPINWNKYVPAGQSLIIHYGSTVQFNGNYYIRVEGNATLTATGVDGDPVLFTSPPGNPTPGYWKALIADGTQGNPATMTLNNCEIRYGGEPWDNWNNYDGVIRGFHYSTVTVDSCYIHDNSGPGIESWDDSTTVEITKNLIEKCDHGIGIRKTKYNSTFQNNYVSACSTGMAIHSIDDSPIAVKNNVFAKNKRYGIYCQGPFNGEFHNNVIDSTGSNYDGMYLLSGAGGSDLRNNIFNDCDNYCVYVESGAADLMYCCFYDTGVGICNSVNNHTGCIAQNPRFLGTVESDDYDYHLVLESPCIATGDPNIENSNFHFCPSDMGAYGGPYADPYFVCITGGGVSGSLISLSAQDY